MLGPTCRFEVETGRRDTWCAGRGVPGMRMARWTAGAPTRDTSCGDGPADTGGGGEEPEVKIATCTAETSTSCRPSFSPEETVL